MNIVIKDTAKVRTDVKNILEIDVKEAISNKSNKGMTKSGTLFAKIKNTLILM